MKRDMDLIRSILLQVEASETTMNVIRLAEPGFSEEQISYHVKLLNQAGLVEAMDMSTHDGLDWQPTGLTWEGHEFLEPAKNKTLWEEAKKQVVAKGVGLSFSALGIVLRHYVQKGLGVHLPPLS